MKSTLLSLLLLMLAICVLANSLVSGKLNEDFTDQELERRAQDLRAKCMNKVNRDICEEGAGGFAQELLGYLNSVLASSNDTFVSHVAPSIQKSWETVLNITENLSSAAEPGERFLDNNLRNLTKLCNETFQSLARRTASIGIAHTNILKAARRSYLPGLGQSFYQIL
jgi:hypothetical protein